MQSLFKVIVFIIFIVFAVHACKRINEVNSWPEASGAITWNDVDEYRDSERYKDKYGKQKTKWEDKYRVTFGYSFEVNGVEYEGDFKVDDLERNSDINRQLKRYPEGKSITIKYDPKNPYDNQFRK